MHGKLEFFYDYVSSYSYLANSQLGQFENVVYRPMFLGGVMQATGNRPPATVKAKGQHLAVEIDRWARRYEIEFRMNSIFPQNTLNALRLAIVAQNRGKLSAIHQSLFDAMWIHDRDLSDINVLRVIAAEAELPADKLMTEITDQSVKDALKANTEEAVSRGVFGAPTFFIGEQMYFGNDRFEFIKEGLQQA